MTDLLVGSVPDLFQLSDQGVDHQRPFQLLLVSVQISMKLTPPVKDETFSGELRKPSTEE